MSVLYPVFVKLHHPMSVKNEFIRKSDIAFMPGELQGKCCQILGYV